MKKYSISSLVINCIFRACKIRAHALGGQKWPRSCQPRPLADWGTEPQTSIGQKFVVGDVTCGRLSHLTCDHIKMRDYTDRLVT